MVHKKMKQLVTTLALIVLLIQFPAHAQSPCKKETVEHFLKELSEAYTAKALGKLDAEHPYSGRVRIVIEHSLGEDEYDVKYVANLAEAEQWLKSRETEDSPKIRETRPLLRCKRGLCTYNFDGGILHNHLYLKKVRFSYRNQCPRIKTIFLYDGD